MLLSSVIEEYNHARKRNLAATAAKLEEVIFNLVYNAIEAMDAATGRYRVLQVRTEIKGRDAITMSVRDTVNFAFFFDYDVRGKSL